MFRQSLSVACLILLFVAGGCFLSKGQRYRHFTAPDPLPSGHFLILGFMGGRDSWDDDDKGVRQLALELREMDLPAPAVVQTVENKKRDLALKLIRDVFDRDGDGRLGEGERQRVRLIVYGQSFGGAAVVKLARQLEQAHIPVRLTVQIDSVGRNDAAIPPNVRRAANLYQHSGFFIKGEAPIRAEDPEKTEILGNFEFDYDEKDIELEGVPWYKKIFRVAHAKMDRDPDVWRKVKELILQELRRAEGSL